MGPVCSVSFFRNGARKWWASGATTTSRDRCARSSPLVGGSVHPPDRTNRQCKRQCAKQKLSMERETHHKKKERSAGLEASWRKKTRRVVEVCSVITDEQKRKPKCGKAAPWRVRKRRVKKRQSEGVGKEKARRCCNMCGGTRRIDEKSEKTHKQGKANKRKQPQKRM